MKHGVKQRKLGRVVKQRRALLRSLAISLIEHGRIQTTDAKARELRPFAEKLITRAKTDSVVTRRLLIARLGGHKDAAAKLINDIAPQYKERAGGYTRITKLPQRAGDASPMAVIELV